MAANFGRYSRFILRRERSTGAIWLIALTFFAALLSALYPGLFPDEASLRSLAATMNTPAMVAMMGPVFGLDALTPAMAMAQECLLWFAVAVIVMNIFFVIRHTRADEELGRFEMLASLPVGRLANGFATVSFAFVLNTLASLLIALSALVVPIGGATAAGALAYGLSIGMQGFVFAAITFLCAQLFSTARGSMGAAFSLLGISYIVRAQGDMGGNALAYISPLGLGLRVEAFYSNNFMPVTVLFIEALALAGIALVLNAKRDVGMGVFPARKGRSNASRFLQSPLGFAWRMVRNPFIAWAAGIFALGAAYGAVVGELDSFVSGNEMLSQVLGGSGSLADAFLAMIAGMMALLISIPVVGCVNRLRGEEKRGRIEVILSAAVPRRKLFGCFILIAALESAVFSFLGAFGLYAAAQGTGLVSFDVLLSAMLAYLPALLVMMGLTALFIGYAPRLTPLIWTLFAYSFLMFYFGRMFDMPQWALKLTPFGHVPAIPFEEFAAIPFTVLCIIAVALCAAGLAGYGKRDSGSALVFGG